MFSARNYGGTASNHGAFLLIAQDSRGDWTVRPKLIMPVNVSED